MRQAVRSVHTLLRHTNEADPSAGLRAGMSAAMRYGNTVVLAQSGPALAVLSHPDGSLVRVQVQYSVPNYLASLTSLFGISTPANWTGTVRSDFRQEGW